jgi:hypothetical protein
MTRFIHMLCLLGALGTLGCALLACGETGEESIAAKRDFMQFRREVYPVLLRDCGFADCHGTTDRFFRVWGPGRVRLAGDTDIPSAFDLPTAREVSITSSLALSMIDEHEPTKSILLRKPLSVEAGGAGHLGVDKYGRDVYRTKQDSGYVTIARWVLSTSQESGGSP